MLAPLLLAGALAATEPPKPPPDPDVASRDLLLYLAEFGSGDDAIDPLELEHTDLPAADAAKPAEKRHTERQPTPDHAAPHSDPPSH